MFDPVAGPFVETLAKAATPGGMIIIYGGLSAQPTPFPGGLAMVKGLTIRGYTLFETTRVPARLTKAKDFILQGVQSGNFVPVIDRTFHLQDIADAHVTLKPASTLQNRCYGSITFILRNKSYFVHKSIGSEHYMI